MSIETWCKEFMPIMGLPNHYTPLDCLKHGLQKWIGARKENCEKHSVVYSRYRISDKYDNEDDDENKIIFDDDTCLMCDYVSRYGNNDCKNCIITETIGITCHYNAPNRINIWKDSWYNPEPMISLLEVIIKKVE
jgi:hypothetical protein